MAYIRYNGSLTTPPCSEGVSWFVMRYQNHVSRDQVKQFARIMHRDTNRPMQAVNARLIVE